MNNRERADAVVEQTARDILRLPEIKSRIRHIESTDCRKCSSITLSFLKEQERKIEEGIARLSPRMLRVCRKHADNISNRT